MSRTLAFWILLLLAYLAVVVWLGWWPIVSECGRLPHGAGETGSRILGLWKGC